MKFVTCIYKATRSFPDEERFGLTSQLRRAAVSVASNIAEEQGRLSPREFRQLLGQARGSMLEIETQLTIAHNLGYLDDCTVQALEADAKSIARMLNRLVESISKTAEGLGTGNRQPGNRDVL